MTPCAECGRLSLQYVIQPPIPLRASEPVFKASRHPATHGIRGVVAMDPAFCAPERRYIPVIQMSPRFNMPTAWVAAYEMGVPDEHEIDRNDVASGACRRYGAGGCL